MKKSIRVIAIFLVVMLTTATANSSAKFGVYTTPFSGTKGGSISDVGFLMNIDDKIDFQLEFTNFTKDYQGGDGGSGLSLTGTWYTTKLGQFNFGPTAVFSTVSAGDSFSDLYLGATIKTMINRWLGLKADGYLLHSKSGKQNGFDYKGSAILPPSPATARIAFFVMF